MALCLAKCHRAVDVRVAFDVDAVGGVELGTQPIRCDIASHPDDVVDDDGLTAVDDAGSARPYRTAGTRFDGAERHLDIAIGQPAVERTVYLEDVDMRG